MALMESEMVPLGTPCPDFRLLGCDEGYHSLDSYPAQDPLLIVFMCNHCPYVQAVDDRINQLAKDFRGRCWVVGINPNDPEAYPEDNFTNMQNRSQAKGYVFDYLMDKDQSVARAFRAVCTPDFFLYGADRTLAYRGRLDDSWKDPAAVTREELRGAIEAVLAGRAPEAVQRPSMGCSIKWRNR